MGSSSKAGNKGLPATPRDGAPIEITGLLKSTVTWLDQLSKNGQFPFKGVNATGESHAHPRLPKLTTVVNGQTRLVTYAEWANLLQKSFERCYFVPSNPAEDSRHDVNPGMVNRRGIYKDVYGTPKDREWSDYQVRCLDTTDVELTCSFAAISLFQ